jgi:4-aminobutyrate aminotransferase-like enzyme/Ser/Thr protein kinase RdoA (MazF antagonist)
MAEDTDPAGEPRPALRLIQSHWVGVLAATWGIDARLEPLVGELDLNLRATARDGRLFILKVMRAGCEPAFVDMLCAAHAHVLERDASVPVAAVVPTRDGAPWQLCKDEYGNDRLAWLITALEGDDFARLQPKSLSLITELGDRIARLDLALADFTHAALSREFRWDLRTADWIDAHVGAIADPSRRAIVQRTSARFAALKPTLVREPVAAIHNDINDYNILVAHDAAGAARISGLVDFGDLTLGPVVAELAIAAAYIALDQEHPERAVAALVAGYHAVRPLSAPQLDLVWPLALMRLAVSVTNSALMQQERPDDPYVVISEGPAWRLLERAESIPAARVSARLRATCGYPVTDAAGRALAWIEGARGTFAEVIGVPLADVPFGALSAAGSSMPTDPFHLTPPEALALGARQGEPSVSGSRWLGQYAEPRLIYGDPAFSLGPHKGSDRRTVHIGVDVFAPAGTPVHAPLEGVVEVVEFRERRLDYGGMVILRHEPAEGVSFSTLHGHLSRASVERLRVGAGVARGEVFAALGDPSENGGWDPHLHLQLGLLPELLGDDWAGVADPDDLTFWGAICPNPAALLGLPDDRVAYRPLDERGIHERRRAHFAANLRLSYADPCLFVRGWRTHLFDEWGRAYLDAYNNVPHVGHSHPRLHAIVSEQMRRLNTNTRYLHPAQVDFAELLLARLPPQFTHVFFVNSGSEGNELALRLARAHTGGRDMVVVDHGYHGNTTGAIDISPYKFNRPGGDGRPEWVQVVPVADTYRGEHRGADAADRYAAAVDGALARIDARGGRLAGFIAETFPSVGGQIIPPEGYLPGVYARIRAAGGVCIADEVQSGLGRLGEHYWGFEQQRAMPDIVVMGKPLGNGHPLGAVATTGEVARSFDNGIEFFSTFGGSTVSCRVGAEVLRIVDDEGLQANARVTGGHLLDSLRRLQERHEVIGDVRGIGLFIGVDLVTDRGTRAPATRAAELVKNRLREERILVGTEGPADNILKIRPPLTVDADDVDQLIQALDRVLGETAIRVR